MIDLLNEAKASNETLELYLDAPKRGVSDSVSFKVQHHYSRSSNRFNLNPLHVFACRGVRRFEGLRFKIFVTEQPARWWLSDIVVSRKRTPQEGEQSNA